MDVVGFVERDGLKLAAPAFQPRVATSFGRGALGERDAAEWRPVTVVEERLASGTLALRASPSDAPPTRGVVIASSLRGLTGMMTELVLRLAQRHGWSVSAPDPFPELPVFDEAARSARIAVRGDRPVLDDLAAAAATLGDIPVALVGFCMGGMYALKSATSSTFDRVVSFYGMIRPPAAWHRDGDVDPLDSVAENPGKVLAVVAGLDALTPPDDVAALRALGVEVLELSYAGHAFAHDPTLPTYRAEDAALAWRTAATFIERARLHEEVQ